MPLRRNKQKRALVQNGEKHLLQSLAAATAATRNEQVLVLTPEGVKYCNIIREGGNVSTTSSMEALHNSFAQRQKKSSATMLRRKLSRYLSNENSRNINKGPVRAFVVSTIY